MLRLNSTTVCDWLIIFQRTVTISLRFVFLSCMGRVLIAEFNLPFSAG